MLTFVTDRKPRTPNSALVELITLLSQSRVCERWQIAFVAVNDPKAEIEAALSDIALVAGYAKAKDIARLCSSNFERLLEEARRADRSLS